MNEHLLFRTSFQVFGFLIIEQSKVLRKEVFIIYCGFLIMFNTSESQKISFLDKTKAAREERALEKKRDNAIIVIQSWVRGWLTRIKYERQIL